MGYEQIRQKQNTAAPRRDFSTSVPKQRSTIQPSPLQHYRDIGNQAVQRMMETRAIQAKLTIGQPNDKYEQEADRVADQVMRMPDPVIRRKSSCPECQEEEELIRTKPLAEQITPLAQRKDTCPECMEEAEEEILRTKQNNNQTPVVTSNVESRINSIKGGGQPLSESTRSFFEPRFGTDFSQVRLHTDFGAAETAKSVNAKAFTVGKDVVFGAGQYSPGTSTGKSLLAHELSHVIQQTGSSTGQHDQLEQQASLAAALGKPYLHHMDRVAQMIQREPTYPRRATSDQMITEARRVLSLTRYPTSRDPTVRMWSNVPSNFGTLTTGSIARRIWTHIFLRHFTEPESRGDVESSHPRYFYSHRYGWIDAQHFFGFIDIAETQSLINQGNRQAAFDAATKEGLTIEEQQQAIRDYVILQQEPARDVTRPMQVRPPNTPSFRAPVAVAGAGMAAAARIAVSYMLRGTQRELYSQLDERQRNKFFMDSAKSAFTFEDFVSNQLGIRFFFQHGDAINSAPTADRERLFLESLTTFFSGITVENDQRVLDRLASQLPTIERFEAPKTTEQQERRKHPILFSLPP